MSKVYLASKFSNYPIMRDIREALLEMGHTVTSRWIDLHPDVTGPNVTSTTREDINLRPNEYAVYAKHDFEDLRSADVFVHLTPDDNGGKGGRHVEFGMALALGKRTILIGERENVFHAMPQVEHYTSVEGFLSKLGSAVMDGIQIFADGNGDNGQELHHCKGNQL